MNEETAMPFGLGYEKSVLSTLLKHPDPYIGRAKAEGLAVDHFFVPAHQIVFREIIRRLPAEVELIAFADQLALSGDLEAIGGRGALVDIYTYAPNPSHWSGHVRGLRDYLGRRRAMQAARELLEDAPTADADDVTAMLSRASEAVSEALQSKSRLWTAERAVEELREIMAAAAATETGTTGIPTGIHPLDLVTGGLAPGDLWVVGAETSGGKTALMLQIAAAFCAGGKRVFIDSLEIQKTKVVGRMATCHAGTPYRTVTRSKYARPEDKARLSESLQQVSAWHLTIDDEGGRSVEEIAGMAEMARDMMGGIDLIVVDYLQRVRASRGRRNDNREQEVAHISSSLKSLAMRLQVPVLTASQLNEKGKVRESRAIAQDADVLLTITEDGICGDKVRDGERDQLFPVVLDGSIQRFIQPDTNQ